MNNNEFGARLAKETLTGDIAAFLIDRLRAFPKPYQQMSEKEQGEQIEMAKSAARELVSKAVGIVASGGRKTVQAEMGKITGTGCQLSGMMTAFITANPDNRLEAAAAAVAAMGLAGEIGWSHMQEFEGNSTYRNRIIDAICNMTGDILNQGAKYEVR